MVRLSATTAAALNKSYSALVAGLYSYRATLQLEVTKNGGKTPTLVSDILTQMLLHEPALVFTDCNDNPLNNYELPSDKATFNLAFGITTKNSRFICSFGIKSYCSFHKIKTGVWQLLLNNNLWLNRKPGLITKQHLVPMGFWLNAHPGLASPQAFKEHICLNIASNYDQP
jgi:hypothetical protein